MPINDENPLNPQRRKINATVDVLDGGTSPFPSPSASPGRRLPSRGAHRGERAGPERRNAAVAAHSPAGRGAGVLPGLARLSASRLVHHRAIRWSIRG